MHTYDSSVYGNWFNYEDTLSNDDSLAEGTCNQALAMTGDFTVSVSFSSVTCHCHCRCRCYWCHCQIGFFLFYEWSLLWLLWSLSNAFLCGVSDYDQTLMQCDLQRHVFQNRYVKCVSDNISHKPRVHIYCHHHVPAHVQYYLFDLTTDPYETDNIFDSTSSAITTAKVNSL